MEDLSLMIFIYAQLKKMAAGDGKDADFYGVLGLEKECTAQELRKAYKRLALRWHPDRCSGSTRSVEEAKKKFQDIQEAYSVLSDSNKRFLYDVGLYQKDDDEEHMQDMGDFLSEMAAMVSQTKPTEKGEESLEQLQELFDEMFQDDNSLPNTPPFNFNPSSGPSSFYSSSFNGYGDNSNPIHRRHSPDYANSASSPVDAQFQNFRQGSGGTSSSSSWNGERMKRRNSGSRKH